MGTYTTEALVLGVRNWGDADKMVTLFTRERGKLQGAAFGCRRPRSPLAAGMQMFHHVELQLMEGRRADTVKQCALLHRYKKLGEDLTAMAYGSFVAEVAREFLPEHAAEPDVFDLLLDVFGAFEERNPRIAALAGAWQLLAKSGCSPALNRCAHCGKEMEGDAFYHAGEGGMLCNACASGKERRLPQGGRTLLLSLEQMDWKRPENLRVTRENLLAAEQVLLLHLQGALGKPLKSLAFIQQL